MKKISRSDLPRLFEALSQARRLYIPADDGSGQAKFLPYTPGMELTQNLNTVRSAKDLFFPQVENLLKFKVQGKQIEILDDRDPVEPFVIFGVRACDCRSFDVLDNVFLHAEPADTFYQARRENAVVMTLACNAPEETCFCHAFGIDATKPETDVQTWLVEGDLFWQAVTPKGEELTAKLGALLEEAGDTSAVEEQANMTQKILSVLPLHGFKFNDKLPANELKVFNSKVWEKLAPACLSCCTCTYVCPTCHCYDIRDYEVGEGKTERFRCWDSCMASDFTKMAHGNPRKSRLERFRQRYMHKLVYYPENNDGIYSCVGCGRCLQKCPVNLNIVKVAKALEVSDDV